MVVADRTKHARIGRVAGLALPSGREPELLEQDPGELLGRAELELLARELERARLELLDALGKTRGDLSHAVGLDPDAGVLHVGEDGCERQLHLVVELLHAPLAQAGTKLRRETACGLRPAHQRGGLLLGRRLGHELDAVLAGQVVELVAGPAGVDQIGGDQGVVPDMSEALGLGVVREDLRRAQGSADLIRTSIGEDDLRLRRDGDATVRKREPDRRPILGDDPLPPRNGDRIRL